MTTTYAFTPPATGNFQFNTTLDGLPYVVVVTWNAYGQRYYVNVYDTARNLILSRPLIASPPEYNINLLIGYFFTSTMTYGYTTNNFVVTP